MARVLISPTTSSVSTSDLFRVGYGRNKPSDANIFDEQVTIIATNLAGAETINLKISPDDGSTFYDLYEDGSQVQLTATNTARTVLGPGVFAVSKSSTTGSVGVYLSSTHSP